MKSELTGVGVGGGDLAGPLKGLFGLTLGEATGGSSREGT